jgi:hypothetical protein
VVLSPDVCLLFAVTMNELLLGLFLESVFSPASFVVSFIHRCGVLSPTEWVRTFCGDSRLGLSWNYAIEEVREVTNIPHMRNGMRYSGAQCFYFGYRTIMQSWFDHSGQCESERNTVDHDIVIHARLTSLLCQLLKAENFARIFCVPVATKISESNIAERIVYSA